MSVKLKQVIAGIFAGASMMAPAAGASAYALPSNPPFDKLPACEYEDGNTDGKPCVWTDPDTGDVYYVDSRNYWTEV